MKNLLIDAHRQISLPVTVVLLLSFAISISSCNNEPAPTLEPEWKKVNTLGTSETLLGVAFTTPSIGYIVGTNGLIKMTGNGGATWTTQTSGTTSFLRDISFASGFGVIVGEGGLILNGNGSTWESRQSGTTQHLVHVHMLDAEFGMASGQAGVIIKTTNGGETWSLQESQTSSELAGIHMLSDMIAVCVGFNSTILKTVDGGTTWNKINVTGLSSNLRSVHFLSDLGLIVGTGGKILRSTDGGTTWTIVDSNSLQDLYAVRIVDADLAYAAGTGEVLVSRDGGVNWELDFTDIFGGDIYSISTAGDMGWMVGQNGVMLHNESF